MRQVDVASAVVRSGWLDNISLDVSGRPVPAVVRIGERDEPGDGDSKAERELGVVVDQGVLCSCFLPPPLLRGDPVGGDFLQRCPAVRAAEVVAKKLGVEVIASVCASLHCCDCRFSLRCSCCYPRRKRCY